MSDISATTRIVGDGGRQRLLQQKLRLEVNAGPDRGQKVELGQSHTTVGTAPTNDLVLTDPSVSRFHLRLETARHGFRLVDLGSTNGTFLREIRINDAVLSHREKCDLRLGETRLRFTPLSDEEEIPLAVAPTFGAVVGESPTMRALFARLEAVATSDITVLLEGETGTGKGLVAREIHHASARTGGPFVVVDCGALPPSLIESELFGHSRGAFTGAATERPGVFEEADGGTLFLDEIGELDLALQPRLLRAIEQRQVKRLGEGQMRRVDARILAATNQDLQRLVNEGRFRSDLYYRLAVAHLRIPPLRERQQDLKVLIDHLLVDISASLSLPPPALDATTLQELMSHPWRGNVRELRNYLERALIYGEEGNPARELFDAHSAQGSSLPEALDSLPFREAKERWLSEFESGYLNRLLERCQGNVAEAARQSGLARGYLFRLIKKRGLR